MAKESTPQQPEKQSPVPPELQALREGTQQVAQVIGEGTTMINEAQTSAERQAALSAMRQMAKLTGEIALKDADQARKTQQ
ncbi:MAG TPA: hypothetical protein VFT53_00145 [Candidatus Saccharimonadales bacterium]|nr:hypothetical protein [Candidatus Saccharimonadales bacterium]